MLKYVALSWCPENSRSDDSARRMMTAAQTLEGHWEQSICHPGFVVFHQITGTTTAQAFHDNRGVLLGELYRRDAGGCLSTKCDQLSAAEQLRVTETKGDILIDHFWGGYILLLKCNDQLFVRRDPSGENRCYYTVSDGVSIVFSDLADTSHLFEIEKVINWASIEQYLKYGICALPNTMLENVGELGPGEELAISARSNQASTMRFWKASELSRDRIESIADAKQALFSSICVGTGARAQGHKKIALFLSGGLDSSVVLAGLCNSGYSGVIEAHNLESAYMEDISEATFADAMAKYYGVPLKTSERAALNLKAALLRPTKAYPNISFKILDDGSTDGDFQNMISEGVDAIFTGTGGDNIFYKKIDKRVLQDYRTMKGYGPSYWQLALQISRITEQDFFTTVFDRKSDPTNQTSLAFQNKAAAVFSDDWLSEVQDFFFDTHPYTCDYEELLPGKKRHLELLARLSLYERPDNHLEVPADFIDPLITQPILETVLRIPSYLFAHGGQRRGIVKEAFRDALPEKIYYRQRKGFMNYLASSSIIEEIDFIREYIFDGYLIKEGYIDRNEIEKALNRDQLRIRSLSGIIRVILRVEKWLRTIKGDDVAAPIHAPRGIYANQSR